MVFCLSFLVRLEKIKQEKKVARVTKMNLSGGGGGGFNPYDAQNMAAAVMSGLNANLQPGQIPFNNNGSLNQSNQGIGSGMGTPQQAYGQSYGQAPNGQANSSYNNTSHNQADYNNNQQTYGQPFGQNNYGQTFGQASQNYGQASQSTQASPVTYTTQNAASPWTAYLLPMGTVFAGTYYMRRWNPTALRDALMTSCLAGLGSAAYQYLVAPPVNQYNIGSGQGNGMASSQSGQASQGQYGNGQYANQGGQGGHSRAARFRVVQTDQDNVDDDVDEHSSSAAESKRASGSPSRARRAH